MRPFILAPLLFALSEPVPYGPAADPYAGLEYPLANQLAAIIAAAVFGILCGMLYDVCRIIRVLCGNGYKCGADERLDALELPLVGSVLSRREKRVGGLKRFKKLMSVFVKARGALNTAATAAGDLLFLLIVTVFAIILIYNINDGIPRWFHIASAAAGFAAYYFTLGRVVMLLSDVIVFLLRSAAAYVALFIVKIIITPPVRAVLFIATRLYRLWLALAGAVRRRAARGYTKRYLAKAEAEARAVFDAAEIIE